MLMIFSIRVFFTWCVVLFFCFQGIGQKFNISGTPKPIAETKAFFLTDFSYMYRINTIDSWPFSTQERHYLNSELGFMVNVDTKWALGTNFNLELDLQDDFKTYVKLRARRWLKNKRSIDFAPGINLDENTFLMSMDYNFNSWLAITSKIEVGHTIEGKKIPFQIGLKLRSKAGLVAHGAALATFAYFAATWEAD